MTSIKLTEAHKAKLLEMCKELFPKFNEWRYGKVTAEGNLEDFYNKTKNLSWEDKKKYEQSCDFLWIEKDFKYEHDDDIERSETWVIHWFEFCMTHLIVKLSKEFTKQSLSEADYTNNQYPNWFSEKISYHLNPFRNEEFEEDIIFIHPIDYLYDEFKKLKK